MDPPADREDMDTVTPDALDWEALDRDGAAWRRKRLAAATDNSDLGCSLYEIPPDKRAWPYHYHTANAEAMYVLAGGGEIRGPDDERVELVAEDYVALPAGPEGAHQVFNTGDEPLRYLAMSTMNEPEVLRYPDSDKVGVMAGAPPGGAGNERRVEGFYRAADAVGYWTDED
jgi:uncharacterized cupin superfamily protein